MKTILNLIMLAIFSINLGGCASGATLVTGMKRTAVEYEIVKIYHAAPSNYEIIASVQASSELGFTDQDNLDMALEEVKKQAAKVGANGVILKKLGKESSGSFGNFFSNGYGGGIFVGGEDYSQVISGTAIYVK
ncbi:hypothetical protein [Candidatus Thioglobus autotrophicus]|uniref:hypothetical protein n=1 Tax=Candidatus Thioglobus autotrophicus TaxID=1705394 RepID=UPI00299D8898|nr:hypothetical protein [Candidatus Thioglobus autotrophicus]WPE18135.1 hypothetical protein R5P05_00610 [Candidatus Thioglobus autotrophicus]